MQPRRLEAIAGQPARFGVEKTRFLRTRYVGIDLPAYNGDNIPHLATPPILLEPLMKMSHLSLPATALIFGATLLTTGCVKKATKVAEGNKEQVFHFGNGGEPADLDPQIIQGVPEHNVIKALFEGLLTIHPKDLSPQPGVAERWEVTPDGKTYTFYLRSNAVWSNGEPVTADDFVKSYERILNPKLAAPYAEMLQIIEGGEEYTAGKLTDFNKVGVKALGPKKLQITLKAPASFFLSMLNHDAWYPVPIATIEKYGKKYDKENRWTRPENIVSNGPFTLKEWKPQQEIVVVKNPKYWDANQVRLKEIRFYPIESNDAKSAPFGRPAAHDNTVPTDKVDSYRASGRACASKPFYSAYYYRVNVDKAKEKNPALLDARVRRALSMAINRESLVKNVLRAGQTPAYSLTPPGPAGYRPKEQSKYDPDAARRLLSEAGFPGGKGRAEISLLINTKRIAQEGGGGHPANVEEGTRPRCRDRQSGVEGLSRDAARARLPDRPVVVAGRLSGSERLPGDHDHGQRQQRDRLRQPGVRQADFGIVIRDGCGAHRTAAEGRGAAHAGDAGHPDLLLHARLPDWLKREGLVPEPARRSSVEVYLSR